MICCSPECPAAKGNGPGFDRARCCHTGRSAGLHGVPSRVEFGPLGARAGVFRHPGADPRLRHPGPSGHPRCRGGILHPRRAQDRHVGGGSRAHDGTRSSTGGVCAWLIIGSIPAAFAGFLLADFFEGLFSSTLAVGVFLVVTSCSCRAPTWPWAGSTGTRLRWTSSGGGRAGGGVLPGPGHRSRSEPLGLHHVGRRLPGF